MFNIFAETFRVASRTEPLDRPTLRETREDRKRWLQRGHWWLERERDIDPGKF